MRKHIFFTFIVSLFFYYGQAQESIVGTMMYDGVERDYRLYLPSAYDGETTLPLVFNLHGFTSNADQQEFYSSMNSTAEENGFIVCYPNGISAAWNVGWTFGSTEDDVGFVSVMIDDFIERYAVDPTRVYSCGMSNGGFMSYRLACELNDKIAAIASVTGSIVPEYKPNCTPGKAVPLMEIHGTADDVVPYNGSPDVALPIEEVIAFWVDNNACDAAPVVTEIPNSDPTDGSTAQRYDYSMCAEDTEVVLIKIDGGGHTWPGAPITIGSTNQDFIASDVIWEFFNRFSLEMSSSNENVELVHVNISPNPARDYILIESDQSYNMNLYNVNGRALWSGKNLNEKYELDVRNLNTGIYFLQLEKEGYTDVKKIVVAR